MGRKYYIVSKSSHKDKDETNEFWENKDYQEYKEKHGMHFSDKMAMWASAHMENADGKEHGWSVDDVKSAFKALGFEKPEKCTWGDATYLANMYYADFMPMLKAETDAVKMAYYAMKDPDGYEGMAFNRYTSDIMSKNADVPWNKLI